MPHQHSDARYYLWDWPVFVLKSAGAWYLTLIGILGGLTILAVLALLVLWFFGVRLGW
jgi:hypothetical protein